MTGEFRLLGPVEVSYDGRPLPTPANKQRVILAALLLKANRVVPIERLADELWDHDVDLTGRARATLQTHLMRLRQRMAPLDVIRTTQSGYVIEVEPELIDVERFRRAADTGRIAANSDNLEAAASAYSAALREWRGSPLANVDSERMRREDAPGLLEEKSLAQEQFIDVRLALGEHSAVLAELSQLTRDHPLRERLWAALMLALYRCGRQAEALKTYQRIRIRLLEELGVSPAQDLQDLHQRVLAADPMLEQAAGRQLTTMSAGHAERQRVPRQLPLDIAGFAGRERELRELDELLAGYEANSTAASALVATLDGAPGSGKTALAVRWAHRVAHRFPDGQLYLNLRGYGPGEPVETGTALEILLHGLGVPADRIPADQDTRSMLLRSELADRRILVVFDNARDARQVRPLLPGAGRVVAVVTSRNQLRGLTVREGAHRITVGELTHAAAVDLLAQLFGSDRTDAEPVAVAGLVDACARLPLALRVLAERIARLPSVPLHGIASDLRGGALALLDASEEDDTSLRAVFDGSFAVLPQAAARLFRLLGLHPGPDISVPAAAAAAGLPPTEAAGLLDVLASAHMVEQRQFGRYSLHDLLREYAEDRAGSEETPADHEAALRRIFDWYLHTAANADHHSGTNRSDIGIGRPPVGVTPLSFTGPQQALSWFEAERDTLVESIKHASRLGRHRYSWQTADRIWTYLESSGQSFEQLAVQEIAVRSARALDEWWAEARSLNSLALAHWTLDRHQDAYDCLQAAVALARAGGDRGLEGRILCNLGVAEGNLGRDAEAVRTLELARRILLDIDADADIGAAENNIVMPLRRLGRYDEALRYAVSSLDINRAAEDAYRISRSLHSVGMCKWLLREFDEARAALDEAHTICVVRQDRLGQVQVLTQLGDLEHDVGNESLATERWREALRISDELSLPIADDLRRRLADPAHATD